MMMKEIVNVRQVDGDPNRRWFSSDYFDLVIWHGEEGRIIGFQLCYDKGRNEKAVTWQASAGYCHNRIDDGENRPGIYKATPILVSDGVSAKIMIADAFRKESKDIDQEISDFVHKKLLEFKSI
jgi:hypothetical protein